MIEINLLPTELKPANTTPKPRFATIIVGVIIFAALAMWYIHIITIEIPQIEQKTTAAKQEALLRQPELEKYKSLVQQKKQFALRQKAVQTLIESRVSMEIILDNVCDLLSPTDIWFTSFDAKKPVSTGRRRATPASRSAKAKGTPLLSIDMNCRIQAPNDVRIKRVAEFFESFRQHAYFSENFLVPTFSALALKKMRVALK